MKPADEAGCTQYYIYYNKVRKHPVYIIIFSAEAPSILLYLVRKHPVFNYI